jgi:hypothetical protein
MDPKPTHLYPYIPTSPSKVVILLSLGLESYLLFVFCSGLCPKAARLRGPFRLVCLTQVVPAAFCPEMRSQLGQ